MLTCSNCGATVREGAKFCTTCGTRLNDVSSTSTTSVWQVPDANPPASTTEPTASTSDAAAPASGDTASTGERVESTGEDKSAFTWSWGAPATSDATDSTEQENVGSGTDAPAPDGDDEPPAAADDATSHESGTDGEPVADATELTILDDEQEGSSAAADETEAAPDEATPEVDDAFLAVPDEEPAAEDRAEDESEDESGGTETLAAWAGSWDDNADDDANGATAEEAPATLAGTSAAVQDESTTDSDPGRDAGGEDTVARAERLIGELKALIPSMVRPNPPIPAAKVNPDSDTVANDLEAAARVGKFDDVRDTLLAVRDNPRDVDNVLRLSATVDRLLELLDDRNNLAKTAESAATRLRGPKTSTER